MKPLILLTNDDGIQSPGLAAAAAALDSLGELLIVAPQEGQTSMSRSRTQKLGGDGTITRQTVAAAGKSWDGFGVKATPALAVIHAIYELAPRPISLVVSGINYGENVASCVTVSGTIGAAIEAAEKGVPAIAVSQEIAGVDYHGFSSKVDFDAAGYFTQIIAEKMLKNPLPNDADIIKLEVPLNATPETRCVVARQDRLMYYKPVVEERDELFGSPASISYLPSKGEYSNQYSDAYALSQGWVCVTPLSFDLTSRGSMSELAGIMEIPYLKEENKS